MDQWNFKDKIYLVTGTSSGIGQSCAQSLLQEGAIVAGIDVQAASIQDPGYTHYTAGITDEERIVSIVEDIKNSFGRIDGLVNAAGRWGNSKPFYEVDTSDWERIISVNLTGMYIVSKYVSRVMIPQKSGKIVNISCIRSSIFRNNMADYAASKGGVVSLTAAMALDLAPHNINVNSVAPGFTYTGMTKGSFDNEEIREQSEKLIPEGRIGQAEDISKVVLFLLSDLSAYMTGTNVYADGGYHIQK
ncbi:MAG: SDR family oxidoreductase [Lachnospiraceae bacterium]|nr:SDR family oxidoreductase [Lachnospiraceae bacterium]